MLYDTLQTQKSIERRLLASMAPPKRYTAREWAEGDDGPVLSARTSSVAGRINLDLTPYLREPLEAFSDPGVKRLFLCFGTQSGKTTFLQCILGFIIDQQPGPTMFLRPSEGEAKSFSDERMVPIIEDTPSLNRHVLGKFDSQIKSLTYEFDRMTLSYAWSGSESSVRGRPIRYVIKDESSAYEPGASALADERCKSFWNSKIVETSTPKMDTDTIWRALGLKKKQGVKPEDALVTTSYEAATSTSVYFYLLECPHCHGRIRLEMKQLRWPKDEALRDIDDHGWYECQLCGGKITDSMKQDMVRTGEWVSENPGGSWRGYHLNSLYAPWASCRFGAVAAQYIRARSSDDFEVMRAFVNNWCGLPYTLEDIGADTVTDAGVEASKIGGHLKNQLDKRVRALTLGVDVQGNVLYWVVEGWAATEDADGKTSIETWVVSWGQSTDFDELEKEVLKRGWAHPEGGEMHIVAGVIDGRYRTDEVKAFCSRYSGIMSVGFGAQTIKRTDSTSAQPFRATAIDRDSKGKALVNSRIGYMLNTTYWKQWLYARLNELKNPKHHLPKHDKGDKDAKAYIRHLSSEMEVVVRVKGSTETKRVWKVRRGYEANHWLDGTVYASAIAFIRGLFGLTPDSERLGIVDLDVPKKDAEEEKPKRKPRLFERRRPV